MDLNEDINLNSKSSLENKFFYIRKSSRMSYKVKR